MNILSIDTSTDVMGVALTTEEKALALSLSNNKKNHAARCVPTIQQVMQDAGLQPQDLDGIAVAQGPGSYTGLRIGLVTAKTLAWTLRLPLLGFSSLEILAAQGGHFPGFIVPLFDARRGRIYTGLYQWQGERLCSVLPDQHISVAAWIGQLEERVGNPATTPILLLGNDLRIHRQTFLDADSALQFQFGHAEQNLPDVVYMGRVAAKQIEAGHLTYEAEDVEQFQPHYLRMAEAEVKWLAKQQEGRA